MTYTLSTLVLSPVFNVYHLLLIPAGFLKWTQKTDSVIALLVLCHGATESIALSLMVNLGFFIIVFVLLWHNYGGVAMAPHSHQAPPLFDFWLCTLLCNAVLLTPPPSRWWSGPSFVIPPPANKDSVHNCCISDLCNIRSMVLSCFKSSVYHHHYYYS